jgi:hypothetical protein
VGKSRRHQISSFLDRQQTVSPIGKFGDAVSLVTIAQTPENLLLFGADANTVSARTRIFFNRKCYITEADIVLNPYEQFSTDGSFGTFDFEATLTHEIGHLFGTRPFGGDGRDDERASRKKRRYNLTAFSARTLAEDDLAGIRTIYGASADEDDCCGTLAGRLCRQAARRRKIFRFGRKRRKAGASPPEF